MGIRGSRPGNGEWPDLRSSLGATAVYPAETPLALRVWKHSRQNTGRPCVGRKGTVVSLPHWEQLVFVSERICNPPATPGPAPSARLALHPLQRFGSFLKPLSAKNIDRKSTRL